MTRILLVEDNPGDAVIFREKIGASEVEHELVHAKRLSEGIERIGDTAFDILMVDLSLPDAHGMDTVRQVRAAAPHLPLIVLTGLDDATAAAEAKNLGAVDYLVKWYVDSPSLARYIRYAIAQNEMNGGGGAPPPAPDEVVVEGQIVRPVDAAAETELKAMQPAEPASPPEAEPVGGGPAGSASPLASADLLREAAEAALAFARHAERRSAWMADVLRSTLDLQRVASGEVEVRAEPVDVLDLARQAVGAQRDLAMQRGLPLHIASDHKKVMAEADRNLVLNLMRRLVVDALQSADAEGVRLRVAVEGQGTLVEAVWTESGASLDAAAACVALGRSVVEQAALLAGGDAAHTADASGRHVLTLQLPGPA